MTDYPKILDQRFAATLRQILQDISALTARTAAIDSGQPLAMLPAVVDPAYTSGDPHLLLNGSAALSGPYPALASYTPAAGDTVLAAPVQGSYVVLGKYA